MADSVQNVTMSSRSMNDSSYLLSWWHPSRCSLIFRVSYWQRGSSDKQVYSSSLMLLYGRIACTKCRDAAYFLLPLYRGLCLRARVAYMYVSTMSCVKTN